MARNIKAVLDEDDLDDWPDRVVKIYSAQIKIRQDMVEEKLVDTIRAMKSELDKPPASRAKALKNPPDDDIPFLTEAAMSVARLPPELKREDRAVAAAAGERQ